MGDARSPLDLSGRTVVHLCVDMQKMFSEDTDWRTPWMDRVMPIVQRIAERHPEDTVYTRFMPPRTAEEARGAWRSYFERWRDFTLERIDPALLDLVDPLAALATQGTVVDKPHFSPFEASSLQSILQGRGVDTLVITGAETDVCVLAAVMSAIDLGYYVVLPKDAICSSSDETHDALMTLYAKRFSQQVHLSEDVEDVLDAWAASREG
jgi:nicotinamidase-related amidase